MAHTTNLRSTLISFSKESSFPLSAFLSIILTAYNWLLFSLDSAKRTSEKAPLQKKKQQKHKIKWIFDISYFIYYEGKK